MPKLSQKDLLDQLRAATDPTTRRDCALDLLRHTRSREMIDTALRALRHEDVIDLLDDNHRPTLREKAAHYFANEKQDRGGLIREQIVRLLTTIGHHDDADLYLRASTTYQRQPTTDTAQNLRAAALVGLIATDRDLGSAVATRLLGEPDTSTLNGQPSITAINALAHTGQRLPIYHFVLRQGHDFLQRGLGEVVSHALEALATEFPAPLYADLVHEFAALDVPVTSSGIINAITTQRLTALYPLVERIITTTKHVDLHHYALVMLAAGRDDALIALLYRLARTCTPAHAPDYITAIELTYGEEREELLALLERRAKA
jgi:hypothetical protein